MVKTRRSANLSRIVSFRKAELDAATCRRHISSHIGMINGQTIERTGKFPIFAGLDGKQTDKLFDE